ncbi:MAG: hypothetical protein HKP14_04150 [Bacteroidia bacterium]|nr:hypothetical protein [Bacteroidia bacterium]
MIRHISFNEIDFDKWDKLVSSSQNGEIFCFSWYLSNFCEWDAIVLDNYSGAIALPTKSRFGFRTVFQPAFIQKCIWFGKEANQNDIESLLKKNYSRIHFNTNLPFLRFKQRDNFVLPLSLNEDELRSNFQSALRRNLRHEKSLQVKKGHINSVYQCYKDQYGHLDNAINEQEFKALEDLMKQHPDVIESLEVYNKDEHLASLLYLSNKQHKRIHYIMGAPTQNGRKQNAMAKAHLHVMKLHLESDWVFDFEGSSIPSVAKFYQKFGSLNEPFFEIEENTGLLFSLVHWTYKRFKRS